MSIEQEKIFKIFETFGAVIDSHIVYTSGKHGKTYVNKDALYPYTKVIAELCKALARQFEFDHVDTVIGPAVGGVILSQWIAHYLTVFSKHQVFGVYADKAEDGKSFIIKRGYDTLVTGKNVLVVDDVMTTGGTVQKVVQVARNINGNVIGVAALCNRGGDAPKALTGVNKLFSLVDIPLETWCEEDCPLCKAGQSINVEVGKGADFLKRKNA